MVAELRPLCLQEAGTEPWDAQAGTVERLSVCAVLQSGAGGTEQVARLLADEDRVTVVVQQLVALEVWRQELLPRLLQSGPPASSFPAYSILFQANNGKITRSFTCSLLDLYQKPSVKKSICSLCDFYLIRSQEACCLSLLESCLYHADTAAGLGEAGPDLLDYTVRALTHLLYPLEADTEKLAGEGEEAGELATQLQDLRQVQQTFIDHLTGENQACNHSLTLFLPILSHLCRYMACAASPSCGS